MRNLLLNAAVMPSLDGVYVTKPLTHSDFCSEIENAAGTENLHSYIGYPQNVQLIKDWTGVEVALNREKAEVQDGDYLIVMRLKDRQDVEDKGTLVHPEDFEYALVTYYADAFSVLR